jgi:hypothetical protein
MNVWNGKKIISGRFGQPGDQSQGFLEKYFVIIPYRLRKAPDYPERTCLPHHNEIAVDDENKPKEHKLYRDQNAFRNAFLLRKDAAVEHIGKLYAKWSVIKSKP